MEFSIVCQYFCGYQYELGGKYGYTEYRQRWTAHRNRGTVRSEFWEKGENFSGCLPFITQEDLKLTNNNNEINVSAECTRCRKTGRREAESKISTGNWWLRPTRWSLRVPTEATSKRPEILRLGWLSDGKTEARGRWRIGQTNLRQQSSDGWSDSDGRVSSNPKDFDNPTVQQVHANQLIPHSISVIISQDPLLILNVSQNKPTAPTNRTLCPPMKSFYRFKYVLEKFIFATKFESGEKYRKIMMERPWSAPC